MIDALFAAFIALLWAIGFAGVLIINNAPAGHRREAR